MRRLFVLIFALFATNTLAQSFPAFRDGLQDIPGQGCFLYPQLPHMRVDRPTITQNLTIDAADEQVAITGQLMTSDRQSHICSSAGCTIGFRAGGVTWSTASTEVIFSLQDLDAVNGPPTEPAESADVSGNYVQGTDTISANTWHDIPMETGTKTVAPGDFMAIVFDMQVRNGADSVQISVLNSGSIGSFPLTVHKTGGSWSTSNHIGNAIIVFDDGAYGWIKGTVATTGGGLTAYNNTDTEDEYGNLIYPKTDMLATGAWFTGILRNGADAELVLYSDPLGTPTEIASLSLDHDWGYANSSGRTSTYSFATPVVIRRGGVYGITLRPTTANDVELGRYLLSSNAYAVTIGGAEAIRIDRADNSGVFDTSSTVVAMIGIEACSIMSRG